MIRNFYKSNYKIILLSLINIFVRGILLLIPTFLISYVFTLLDKSINIQTIIAVLLGMIFSLIIAAILYKVDIYYSRIYLNLANKDKNEILVKMNQSDIHNIINTGEGLFIQNIYNNIASIKSILFWNVNSTIWHVFMIILTQLIMIFISMQLGIVILGMYILIGVINYQFMKLLSQKRIKQFKQESIKNKYSDYIISHRNSIFISDTISSVSDEYFKIVKESLKINKTIYLLEQSLLNTIEALKYIGYFLIFYFYFTLGLPVAALVLFIMIYSWTIPLITNIQTHIINLNQVFIKFKQIKEYDLQMQIVDNSKFETKNQINELDIKLACGLATSNQILNEKSAIRFINGKSGSGKSTLALALANKYQLESGRKQLQEYEYYSNEIILPNTNLMESEKYFNIRIENDILDFLPEFKSKGMLKENIDLTKLSSGQKSRVILYIASQSKFDYIILDEMFSTIDDVTKQKVIKKFRNKKIIIIEHGKIIH
jgi:ABC-type bacteriocin/lantibiotic exporter with double-glycine peptidase domain